MKNKKSVILVVLISLLSINIYPQVKLSGKTIEEYALKVMERWQIPGLAVAIIKNNEIIFSGGFGVRELGKSGKVDGNTVFAVASNTKAFTGTSIALLESDGKLKLDDKIVKYLPNFSLFDSDITEYITIKDVLTHRIGIGTFHGDFNTWGTNFSSDELIEKIRYVEPVFEFRNGYGYFNSGYVIAGKIIEEVSGMSWGSFVKENCITPLEMTRTSTSVTELKNFDNVATPHTFDYNYTIVPIPWRNVDNIAPAASINSSVSDMAKWVLLQLNEGKFNGIQLIDRKVILRTHTPFNLISFPSHGTGSLSGRHFRTYGLGWGIADFRGRLYIEHSGGYDGMLSRTAFMPEEKIGVVILTNNDFNQAYTSIMYQVFDALLETEKFDWDSLIYVNTNLYEDRDNWENIMKNKGIVSPHFRSDLLIGTYSNPSSGELKIFQDDSGLSAKLSSRPDLKMNLDLWHGDTLICIWNDYVMGRCLAPVIIENGEVKGIKLKANDFIDPLYYEFRKE